ncbi:MAG: HAMP domain-containing sensor histidine kinase, partial [bacterium]
SLAKEKGVIVSTEVHPDTPFITADESKLGRVLVNLLGNAMKFTPEGGSVIVRADLVGSEWEFWVTDNGEGIASEAFERIFDKFGQVESRRGGRKMSTGLGLTFCKLAVEAHGGHISVSSSIGEGSTFHFAIPASQLS